MKERNPLYLKLQSRLQIISFPGSILSMCHLWKCRYRVYWNISYPLSILKVIFLKSNPETLILPLERGCNPTLCYGKCWPNILSKATFNKTNFWFIFSHFCYIKSLFSYSICSYLLYKGWPFQICFRFLSIRIGILYSTPG